MRRVDHINRQNQHDHEGARASPTTSFSKRGRENDPRPRKSRTSDEKEDGGTTSSSAKHDGGGQHDGGPTSPGEEQTGTGATSSSAEPRLRKRTLCKQAFNVFRHGVKDSLAIHKTVGKFLRSELIRRRTCECCLLNGLIFLGSIAVFNWVISPLLWYILLWGAGVASGFAAERGAGPPHGGGRENVAGGEAALVVRHDHASVPPRTTREGSAFTTDKQLIYATKALVITLGRSVGVAFQLTAWGISVLRFTFRCFSSIAALVSDIFSDVAEEGDSGVPASSADGREGAKSAPESDRATNARPSPSKPGVILVDLIPSPAAAPPPAPDYEFDADEAAELMLGFFSLLYKILWLYPIYCVSFILNTINYQDIADQSFDVSDRNFRRTTTFQARLADECFRVIFNLVYILLIQCVYAGVPWLGKPIYFIGTCWLASLYCFEYRWVNLGWTSADRLGYFERHWLYFFGFGTPIGVLCFISPRFIDNGIFALIFPLFILTSSVAVPRELKQHRLRKLPIFWAVLKVTTWMLRATGGVGGANPSGGAGDHHRHAHGGSRGDQDHGGEGRGEAHGRRRKS